MLVSWGAAAAEPKDRFSNTLYFNVSGGGPGTDPDYQQLASDLGLIYMATPWCAGLNVQVRAYNMSDAKPRPERAYYTNTASGSAVTNARQIALALSYYADRNLPRRRGRVFTGPWAATQVQASNTQVQAVKTFGEALAGLGGLNVDWSIYSPTTASTAGLDDAHWRISNAWVDYSWDVIRSRKLETKDRITWSLNG